MIHWDILDSKRKKVLPLLKVFTNFYLAGGTALALQIGHRDSIDFDFFSLKEFDEESLLQKCQKIFKNNVNCIQKEKNTLTIIVNDEVKISFFAYNYLLLNPLEKTEYFQLASLEDILCMKFSAVVGRATKKDYIDLYYLLQKISLSRGLELLSEKMPSLDINLTLKSLIYFEDILEEPILFMDKGVKFEKVKKFLKKEVKRIA